MKELVIATKNIKKRKEIHELLGSLKIKLLTLNDFKNSPDVIEDGLTFRDNAVKKAVSYSKFTKCLTLAEDSGLEVRALGKKPGVRSSRFAGLHKSDLDNNLKLLKKLKNVPYKKRNAQYVACVALARDGKILHTAIGRCSGVIGFTMKGSRGFGYDPLFIIPKFGKTFGELGEGIKHTMSHRFKALRKIKPFILKHL